MENVKMTREESKEVVLQTLKNMNYLEIYRLASNLCDDTRTRNKAIEYLEEKHEGKLNDAMLYIGVIEDEEISKPLECDYNEYREY